MRTPGLTRQQASELADLRRAMRRVELAVAREAAPAAALAAAKVLRAAVVREAPRDTGFLASRVQIVAARGDAGGAVLFVEVGDHDFQGKVFYAAMVEYGTSKMEANPFMRRAVDLDGERAVAAGRRAFADEIKGVFRR